MLTREQSVKKAVPPAMRDRYVVRITGAKFGLSSKQNPMITVQSEVVGVPVADGVPVSTIKRGDTSYEIAGLRIEPVYFTLVDGPALDRFIEFYEKVTETPFERVDDTNPDLEWLKGNVCMEALLEDVTVVERKILTPEDRVAGKVEGDPITGADGKPITKSHIRYGYDNPWICRYHGQLNPF